MQERTPSAGTLRRVDATRAHTDRVVLLPLAAAVIVAAAIVGWLVFGNRGPAMRANVAVGPVLVSAGQLTSASHSLGRPIYWAGPRENSSYELTVTAGGRAYVRYLPRGTAAGDSRADFLTVGTYPGTQAYENLKKVSTGPAVHSNLLDDGGLLVAPKRLPKSVYLAYPEADYQVEVYDSRSGAARRLALNGLIKQIR
jgi:hypothetical protein